VGNHPKQEKIIAQDRSPAEALAKLVEQVLCRADCSNPFLLTRRDSLAIEEMWSSCHCDRSDQVSRSDWNLDAKQSQQATGCG
jgi:hypothetical protein